VTAYRSTGKKSFSLPVLALEENVDQEYGEIRTAQERIGQPIGDNDLLITAHARALRLTVVTANVREFLRVPGLAVENWLE
jgi:tRNA(fMet)-specific endonuclease VapC